jgi:ABC-type oligopeptide transport system substrate-binding subunit
MPADRIVLEEMPLIPFAYYSVARLVDPVVQGWHPSIRDALRLSTLWLSPGEAP